MNVIKIKKLNQKSFLLWIIILSIFVNLNIYANSNLEKGWENPPNEARLRAYWWWLNGNVTKKAITRDLEEMKKKGFGGA
mgnify:FL=1